MHRACILLLTLMVALPLCSRATGQGALRPVDLRCEYRTNPLGVDTPAPRLSWKLEAVNPTARGLSSPPTGFWWRAARRF